MGDSGEGLIDAEARIQERQEEMERARVQRLPKTVRDPETRPRARVVEARADRARAAARRDDARAAPRAAPAGDRGSRPPHDRDQRRGLAALVARMRDPPRDVDPCRSSSWRRCDGRRGRAGTCSIRHLARLEDSARHFRFACPRSEIRDALDRAVRSADAPLRVRLLLAADGAVRVEQTPLELGDRRHARAVRAAARSIPSDVFLFHKTTNRAVYERARRPDCDDVILWNPAGEVTETTIANLVVEDSTAAGASRRRSPAACCPARCARNCWRRARSARRGSRSSS